MVALLLAGCTASDDGTKRRGGEKDASTDTSCAAGTERCECYGNATCNAGLTCASNLCVTVGGAGGATSAGGAAHAGAIVGPGSGGAIDGGGDRDGGRSVDGGSPITERDGGHIIIGPSGSGGRDTVGCMGDVNPVGATEPDILVMFDQSNSMSCAASASSDRWSLLKKALQDYVVLPEVADLSVGIQYFGLGGIISSCNAADYQTPEVEIAPLSKNAQAIVSSLNNHSPSATTPTPAALTGAVNHAIDWKNAHHGHSVVVLLVTDGEPNACGAVSDAVAVASAGLMNTIPTYVIGVTSPGMTCTVDPNPPNQQDLDAVAKAGGTSAASIVDVTKDVGSQFAAAMNAIRAKSTVPCTFPLPEPSGGPLIDPNKVNVQYTPTGGTTPVFVTGTHSSSCDPVEGGWYYDNDAAPSQIVLCPSTCSAVGKAAVDVVLGCATRRQ